MNQTFSQLVSELVKQPTVHPRFVFVQHLEGVISPDSDAFFGMPDAEYPGYVQAFSAGFICAVMGNSEGEEFNRRIDCLVQLHNRGVKGYAAIGT